MRIRHIWLLLVAALVLGAGPQVQAALQIEITGGINSGYQVAVIPFTQDTGTSVDVAAVITEDLRRSGKFSPLPMTALPRGSVKNGEVVVDVAQGSGAEAVITGKVYREGGTFQVEYKVTGLQGQNRGQVLAHARRQSSAAQMRQAAHLVSDRVYELFTKSKGAFRTRIAYVVYRPGADHPYQLMTADYDCQNEVPILKSTQPIMTPSWSPDGQSLAYVSFERRTPCIYLQNIVTRKRELLAAYPGLNSSPAWSPDGTRIAMTLSNVGKGGMGGTPNIYYFDLRTRQLHQVTANPAIDTEPTWSADGKALFFTSERGGRAQIYKFDFETRQTERVTYQGQVNLSARAIPDSNSMIVITGQNGYRVARLDADGSIYMLTTSQLDESPSVAPNGSMVIYSTVYQGRKGLALVSADGRFKANLPSSEGEISAPAWGPLPMNY